MICDNATRSAGAEHAIERNTESCAIQNAGTSCARAKSSGAPTTIRHGAFLFTALDAATGKVIGRCYPRHRGREFLSEIERHVPPELEARLIMDNDATHKTPTIRKWLGAQPRSDVHFTRPPALG